MAPLIRYYPGWRGRCAAGRPWRAVGLPGAWRMVSEEPGRHASGRDAASGAECADVCDPGTRAVMLEALRDAAGDPGLFPACVVDGTGDRLWAVWLPERVYALIREEDRVNLKPWASEGAALAAALVAVARAPLPILEEVSRECR